MDPQQSQTVNNTISRTGGLIERTPLTLRQRGINHYPADLSFLSSFTSPPLPHLHTFTADGPFPIKGCVVLDSLPPENEESYAKGWYSGFDSFEESHAAAGAESSQVSKVEAIRIKPSVQSEFNSHGAAERACFVSVDERQDDSDEFQIFVGNLAAEVTDNVLEETFKVKYASVKGARIVTDKTTGLSKGYGFVRFADEDEQMRSVTELDGQYCLTKPMYIGPIGRTSTQKATFQSFLGTQNISDQRKITVGNLYDPKNRRVFVHGLDSDITEENLRQIFGPFGELTDVKIHEGKGCGTVQFDNRASAVEAMGKLHGIQLGSSKILLAWARNPSNEQGPLAGILQQHLDSNLRRAGNMYGYTAQDPNMFSYHGYPGY